MATVERKSATEWEWHSGNRHRTVRYFPSTGKLIWSGWTDTSNGPVFEEGYRQSVEDFLANGVSQVSPPDEILNGLREMLEAEIEKQNRAPIWKRWLGLGK
ncbi:MAG: hypothetical protein AAFQ07_18580 [Chloroflexota bacterium]